jgi:hypothetical protein
LQGAAVATFLSYGLCTALLAYFGCKVLPLSIDGRRLFGYLFSATVSVLAVTPLDLTPALLNIVVRALLGALMYLALLYVLDRRIRDAFVRVCRWLYLRRSTRGIVTA